MLTPQITKGCACILLVLLDDTLALDISYTIYKKFEDYTQALRIALALHNIEYVKQVYRSTKDMLMKKQFSYILARHAHLIDGRGSASSSLDSARQYLAATFVNAFVNAGFGQDKLMTIPSESSGSWLFKNKEQGKGSAAASLGMILLWYVDSGLAQIDKYLHSNDNHVVAGALLGVGVVNCGVKNDCNPALALLIDYINKDDTTIRIGAIMGLGIAYAGSNKEEESVEASAEVSKTLNEKIRKYCDITLMSSAYAGTGNVLKIQKLLGYCSQHLDKGETYQGSAVLGY